MPPGLEALARGLLGAHSLPRLFLQGCQAQLPLPHLGQRALHLFRGQRHALPVGQQCFALAGARGLQTGIDARVVEHRDGNARHH